MFSSSRLPLPARRQSHRRPSEVERWVGGALPLGTPPTRFLLCFSSSGPSVSTTSPSLSKLRSVLCQVSPSPVSTPPFHSSQRVPLLYPLPFRVGSPLVSSRFFWTFQLLLLIHLLLSSLLSSFGSSPVVAPGALEILRRSSPCYPATA